MLPCDNWIIGVHLSILWWIPGGLHRAFSDGPLGGKARTQGYDLRFSTTSWAWQKRRRRSQVSTCQLTVQRPDSRWSSDERGKLLSGEGKEKLRYLMEFHASDAFSVLCLHFIRANSFCYEMKSEDGVHAVIEWNQRTVHHDARAWFSFCGPSFFGGAYWPGLKMIYT